MPNVATLRTTSPLVARGRAGTRHASLLGVAVSVATALTVLAVAVLLVLPPFVLHPLLDAAGSASFLGVTSGEAHRLSDLTVTELVLGPGTFAFAGPDGGPLFDTSEASHLRDARALLYGFLAVCAMAAVLVVAATMRARRSDVWRDVARGAGGLAVAIVVIGVIALVAFEPAFELFHRIFFPGGNWAFDPGSQRLVQLYPLAFWRYASALLGVIALVLGAATWALARRRTADAGADEGGPRR
jgi:integral membrane protein (TIGR01906 family)